MAWDPADDFTAGFSVCWRFISVTGGYPRPNNIHSSRNSVRGNHIRDWQSIFYDVNVWLLSAALIALRPFVSTVLLHAKAIQFFSE
jgi:hypothetical protein